MKAYLISLTLFLTPLVTNGSDVLSPTEFVVEFVRLFDEGDASIKNAFLPEPKISSKEFNSAPKERPPHIMNFDIFKKYYLRAEFHNNIVSNYTVADIYELSPNRVSVIVHRDAPLYETRLFSFVLVLANSKWKVSEFYFETKFKGWTPFVAISDLENKFLTLIKTRNEISSREYWKENPNLNIKVQKNIILLSAIRYGLSLEFVRELIENGADVNEPYGGPLQAASQLNRIEIVRLLVQSGAVIDHDYSGSTGSCGLLGIDLNITIVRYLVQQGANINCNSFGGGSVLMNAIYQNKIEIVRFYLESGVDPSITSKFHNTAWESARALTDKTIIRMLEEKVGLCKANPKNCSH